MKKTKMFRGEEFDIEAECSIKVENYQYLDDYQARLNELFEMEFVFVTDNFVGKDMLGDWWAVVIYVEWEDDD